MLTHASRVITTSDNYKMLQQGRKRTCPTELYAVNHYTVRISRRYCQRRAAYLLVLSDTAVANVLLAIERHRTVE